MGLPRGTDVVGMVVRTGLRLVVAGIAIGIPVSLVLGRIIGTQLMGVTVYDPFTLGAISNTVTPGATPATVEESLAPTP